MPAIAAVHTRLAPSTSTASAVSALWVNECDRDTPSVLIPHPVVQLVARFGPSARGGLDVHAMGVRKTVHRKIIRKAQRTAAARLQLGASRAVFGVPASAIAGRVVAIEDLWGEAATRRLYDGLGGARDTVEASAVLERAIGDRLGRWAGRDGHEQLALDAAGKLARASVNAVAADLGVSERHLRRVFRETVGLSPKAFARLTRFHRALRAARRSDHAGWADIAAEAGYYDQAHLIAEFHAIAQVTPRELLGELRARPGFD